MNTVLRGNYAAVDYNAIRGDSSSFGMLRLRRLPDICNLHVPLEEHLRNRYDSPILDLYKFRSFT